MPRALRNIGTAALALAVWAAALPASAAEERVPPYWASISAQRRTDADRPGRAIPRNLAVQSRRAAGAGDQDLPRLAPDPRPDGTEGWVFAKLLTSKRTAMVIGAVRELRTSPDPASPVRWRAQPGVVGTIANCGAGWCELNVDGRKGYVETGALWGVDPGETVK